tara:strand:+ start:1045 stop:1368 length:324 start_codon:yes stop_codon:yes gene_type:complete
MILYQTAVPNPYRQTIESGPNAPLIGEHTFNPSLIVPLHHDPVPFYEDTFISSSVDPETALILKAEHQEVSDYLDLLEPTTTNLDDTIALFHTCQDKRTIIIRRRRA